MILKHLAQYMQGFWQDSSYLCQKWSKYRMATIDRILKTLGPDPLTKRRIGKEALGLLLFDEFDLTHTCCRPGTYSIRPPIDGEDARELADEESDLITQFEALRQRAELEWESSSERFSRFLRKFIQENVYQGRCQQTRDNGYAQALRSIGVQIQEASDDGAVYVSGDQSDAE